MKKLSCINSSKRYSKLQSFRKAAVDAECPAVYSGAAVAVEVDKKN